MWVILCLINILLQLARQLGKTSYCCPAPVSQSSVWDHFSHELKWNFDEACLFFFWSLFLKFLCFFSQAVIFFLSLYFPAIDRVSVALAPFFSQPPGSFLVDMSVFLFISVCLSVGVCLSAG